MREVQVLVCDVIQVCLARLQKQIVILVLLDGLLVKAGRQRAFHVLQALMHSRSDQRCVALCVHGK